MNLSDYKFIKISGINMKSLELDGVEIWRWAYENKVPLSINADGTIYNGGLGYKNNYRVRSGGAEGAVTGASCTGFIRVSGGDVIRFYPANPDMFAASGNAINVYDASFTNLGQAASNSSYGIFSSTYTAYGWGNSCVAEGGGVYRWVVPPAESGIVYIRLSLYDYSTAARGAEMIVTINEEII